MSRDIIIVFNFETGDASCPFWTETAMIHGRPEDVNELIDSITSCCDSVDYEDSSYQELLTDVLNASGLPWQPLSWDHVGRIPECDKIITLFI